MADRVGTRYPDYREKVLSISGRLIKRGQAFSSRERKEIRERLKFVRGEE